MKNVFKILIAVLMFASSAVWANETAFHLPDDSFKGDKPLSFGVRVQETHRLLNPSGETNLNETGGDEDVVDDGDDDGLYADEEIVYAPKGEACPFDRPLRRVDNACFKCEVETDIILDSICNRENNCAAACSNRVIVRTVGGSPTSTLKCPNARPLIDSNGICHGCDEDLVIDVVYNEEKCTLYCAGRRYLNWTRCLKCPENRQNLKFNACRQCGGNWIDGRCF